MIQTLTCTLDAADVPEVVRRKALAEGTPLDEFVKEGLLEVARRINREAKRAAHARKTTVEHVHAGGAS